MDFAAAPLFAALADRMRFLAARTSVISENIANADTPIFTPQDIEPGRTAAPQARLAVSDPRHISATAAGGASREARVDAPDADASLNGNRVSLESQVMKLSATRMEYGLAASVYRKAGDLVRLAASGGR